MLHAWFWCSTNTIQYIFNIKNQMFVHRKLKSVTPSTFALRLAGLNSLTMALYSASPGLSRILRSTAPALNNDCFVIQLHSDGHSSQCIWCLMGHQMASVLTYQMCCQRDLSYRHLLDIDLISAWLWCAIGLVH